MDEVNEEMFTGEEADVEPINVLETGTGYERENFNCR